MKVTIQTAHARKKIVRKIYRSVTCSFFHKCVSCTKSFESKCGRSKFCSKQCKSRFESQHRIRGIEVRKCIQCQKEFTTRSDTSSLCCGRSCGVTNYLRRIESGMDKR